MKIATIALIVICAALTSCSSLTPASSDFAVHKMRLIQQVLDKTPDASVGYWKLDDKNFGLITVDSTMRKGSTTCRLVREDEVKDSRSYNLVASYCKEPKGPWQ